MEKETVAFDLSAYADELSEATENLNVGTKVLFENDRVRVWELALDPGVRAPFHCHTIDYFWVAADPGPVVQRVSNGDESSVTHDRGQVTFFTFRDGDTLIHDLENVGDKPIRYITVELLDGNNTMPHTHA
jgi:hypothetical protein